jgi:hypothetical protein
MKHVFLASVLLLTAMGFAQQGQSPNDPPQTTPPTFPQTPREQMPPEQEGRPLSTVEVQQQIQKSLTSEPDLANTNVAAKTDENSVTLNGMVDTERQHQIALRVAQSYAGDRKIVDNISLRSQGRDASGRPL